MSASTPEGSKLTAEANLELAGDPSFVRSLSLRLSAGRDLMRAILRREPGSFTRASSTAAEPCPRCHGRAATLTLLTSMVRYYTCQACECRWQAPRV